MVTTFLILYIVLVGEPPTTMKFLVVGPPTFCGAIVTRYLSEPPKFKDKVISLWSVTCTVQAKNDPA